MSDSKLNSGHRPYFGRRDGRYFGNYRRNGPRHQTCLVCGTTISTNALARASHERGKKHMAAIPDAADATKAHSSDSKDGA